MDPRPKHTCIAQGAIRQHLSNIPRQIPELAIKWKFIYFTFYSFFSLPPADYHPQQQQQPYECNHGLLNLS